MQPSQLDLILAWAFRDWPIVFDRLAAQGVRREDTERAWERYRAGREQATDLSAANADHFIGLYGVEPRRDDLDTRRLRWPLALWPEHELVSVELELGAVFEEGLRFREPPTIARVPAPLTLEGATQALRVGKHTEAEMQAALGPADPDEGNGWSPESYFYYDLADGRVLRCLSVHGLLVEVSALAARPLGLAGLAGRPAPGRRWWEFWKPAA